MTRNDKARLEAAKIAAGLYWEPGVCQRITVPDYGEVQWGADGTAYVEAMIEVPAAMLREEGKDA